MTTIRLFCQGATARARVDGAITAGAVGIPVEITCDSAWDGLLRTIVFMTPVSRSAVSGVEDSAVVPGGVLVPGQHLYIAMEGRDDDGDPVIPTNWADCGVIRCSSAGTDEIEYPAVPGGGSGEDGGCLLYTSDAADDMQVRHARRCPGEHQRPEGRYRRQG